MGYGLPYMGSKSRLIKRLSQYLPNADHFYDVFGGGSSVSHFMAKERPKSFRTINYNEIDLTVCELVKDSIAGIYSYDKFKPDWISRDDFYRLKDSSGYVQQCWSFGNNGKNYLFSREIEPYKKSMHMAIVFDCFDDLAKEVLKFGNWPDGLSDIKSKRLYLRNKIESYKKTTIPSILHQFLSEKQLQQLEQLQRLEQLERLEQLQQLERLKFNITNLDYQKLTFKSNSTIYCDPPYEGTGGYKRSNFNKSSFLDWAHSQQNHVYISEYNVADPRFELIAEFKLNSTLSATNNGKQCIERLYCNKFVPTHKLNEQLTLF